MSAMQGSRASVSSSCLPVVSEEHGEYLISSSLEQTIDALIQPCKQRRRRQPREERVSLGASNKGHKAPIEERLTLQDGQEEFTSYDIDQPVQKGECLGDNGGQTEGPRFPSGDDNACTNDAVEAPYTPQEDGEEDNDEEEASPYGETFSLSAFSSLPDYHDLIDAVLELQETQNPTIQLQGLDKIKNFSPGDILMTDGWVGIRNQLLSLLTMKKDYTKHHETVNAKRLELHNAILDTLYSLFSAACSGNSPQTIEIALGVVRHLYVQQNIKAYCPPDEYLEKTVASSFGLLARILYDLGDKEILPDEELLSQYQILLFLLLGKGISMETGTRGDASYLEHFFSCNFKADASGFTHRSPRTISGAIPRVLCCYTTGCYFRFSDETDCIIARVPTISQSAPYGFEAP
eukprot:gb/GECG01012443.1/.p1 GENE.gb/GECG01012443.1/~~gb/GECG01012443.1/.p1  ORF type:complete len:406 (+),score=52.89 gb/GECG01012443.1/:1-1218(+)